MNGAAPKIEIFNPFQQAYDLMKRILFQPFDLKKWCVIGFAAFLANLSGGFNFNFGNWNRSGSGRWGSREEVWHNLFGDMETWVIILIVGTIVLVAIAVGIVFAWLGARGRFMFLDCIVKNRGAIAAPWKEYRKEGNSLFLFSLLVGLIFIVVVGLLVVALVVVSMKNGRFVAPEGPVMIATIIGAALIIFLAALAWALVAHFMVPIMYRRRIRAAAAMNAAFSLIAAFPGEIVLYCLFLLVISIGAILASCLTVCVTCCVAAIPYVGTVILLPVFVWLRSFSLLFLRQFGADYDVWVGEADAETPSALPSPPPVQT